MILIGLLALGLTLTSAAVIHPTASAAPTGCPSDVFFLGARGSGETAAGHTNPDGTPDQYGGMGEYVYKSYHNLNTQLTTLGKTSNYNSVEYQAYAVPFVEKPAPGMPAVDLLTFLAGINDGVTAARQQLQSIVLNLQNNPQCAGAQVVLGGYSQGAMVMHRLVNSLNYNVSADRMLLNRIGGILLIADGDRIPYDNDLVLGTAWDGARGVATVHPEIGGVGTAPFQDYVAQKTLSICNAYDPVCDSHSSIANAGPVGIAASFMVLGVPSTILLSAPDAYATFKQLAIHSSYQPNDWNNLLYHIVNISLLNAPNPPTITSKTFPPGIIGQPYTTTLTTADNRPGVWTIATGSLPHGLTLQGNTITGTPTTPEQSTAQLVFTDTKSQIDSIPATITVSRDAGTRAVGTVYAWDTGTTPTPISGLTNVTTIAANYGGTIYALKSDGTVYSRGYNHYGQLGDGSTVDHSTPVQVSGLANITSLAAGAFSGYALRNDGTVYSWGANYGGQLGDGTTVDHSTPVHVSGLTHITEIAAGAQTGYALKDDGTMYAWGYGALGQLGNYPIPPKHIQPAPVLINGLTGVTSIAGGGADAGASAYAVRSDGTVYAWGCNDFGELGEGTTHQRDTPVQVIGLTNITKVAAGVHTAYALRSDGTVYAWGSNSAGELGDGTTTNRSTPIQISSLANITDLAGGGGAAYALESDGVVYAWGTNYNGQLGGGADRSIPAPISGLPHALAIASYFALISAASN